ncbi:MAG: hypothetical protein ACO1SV_25470 [Fimbriimonas sp.]
MTFDRRLTILALAALVGAGCKPAVRDMSNEKVEWLTLQSMADTKAGPYALTLMPGALPTTLFEATPDPLSPTFSRGLTHYAGLGFTLKLLRKPVTDREVKITTTQVIPEGIDFPSNGYGTSSVSQGEAPISVTAYLPKTWKGGRAKLEGEVLEVVTKPYSVTLTNMVLQSGRVQPPYKGNIPYAVRPTRTETISVAPGVSVHLDAQPGTTRHPIAIRWDPKTILPEIPGKDISVLDVKLNGHFVGLFSSANEAATFGTIDAPPGGSEKPQTVRLEFRLQKVLARFPFQTAMKLKRQTFPMGQFPAPPVNTEAPVSKARTVDSRQNPDR